MCGDPVGVDFAAAPGASADGGGGGGGGGGHGSGRIGSCCTFGLASLFSMDSHVTNKVGKWCLVMLESEWAMHEAEVTGA